MWFPDRIAVFYANLYKKRRFRGGHIILLNARDSEYYEATKKQAMGALQAYPGGLQIGGGITAENAEEFLQQEQVMSLSRLMYSVMERFRWID